MATKGQQRDKEDERRRKEGEREGKSSGSLENGSKERKGGIYPMKMCIVSLQNDTAINFSSST